MAAPLPKPRGGKTSVAGFALSDDFSTNELGVQWCLFDPKPDESDRSLVIRSKESSAVDNSPLTCIVGDRSYEASVVMDISAGAQGGLLLFYNHRGFCGIGFSNEQMFTYNYGEEHAWMRENLATRTVHLKVTNRNNVVTFHYSHDGANWKQHPWQMEVSGFHHNVFGGFLSLRVGVYAAGAGELALRNFEYCGLGE